MLAEGEYDPSANALYLHFSNSDVMWTEEVNGMTLVDLDADGGVVGVEILHPQRIWPIDELIERFAHDTFTARQLRTVLTAGEQQSRAA